MQNVTISFLTIYDVVKYLGIVSPAGFDPSKTTDAFLDIMHDKIGNASGVFPLHYASDVRRVFEDICNRPAIGTTDNLFHNDLKMCRRVCDFIKTQEGLVPCGGTLYFKF